MITGFTCSAFDFLHAGHVLMLKECWENCDTLYVGLHTDPTIDRPDKNKPIQSVLERYIQLDAIKYIDHIIPYETEADLLVLLSIIANKGGPVVRFVGEDWKNKKFTGHELQIPIYYNKRYGYSTTDLRKRIEGQHEQEEK